MDPKSPGNNSGASDDQSENTSSGNDRKSLGKYTIEKKLGSGGMGSVYLAIDTETNQQVALKILSRKKAENPALVKRFQLEAEAASQLKHDHITAIYEAGECDGFLYICLEYVDGLDVQQLMKQKSQLTVERSIQVVMQVTLALQHAFEQGIVHRDIKPSNILIDRSGNVKITDMGLARSVDEAEESGVTRAGMTVGTVDYMAPEQAHDSRAADIRSDLYSLGCAWYHMLTGVPPFPEGTLTNKLLAHQTQKRPDPRILNPLVPGRVALVLRKLMACSPQDRYQTPTDLLEDVERVSRKQDPKGASFVETLDPSDQSLEADAAPVVYPQQRARKNPGKRPVSGNTVLLVSICVGALLVLGGTIWGISHILTIDNSPESESVAINDVRSNDTPTNDGTDRENPAPVNPDQKITNDSASDSTSEDRPATRLTLPIPNTGNTAGIVIGRPEEREHIPPWVANVWSPAEDGSLPPSNKPVYTIGRGENETADYSDLSAALKQIPESGGIVRLQGDGPFVLTPVSLEGRSEVIITSAKGSQPLILLAPGNTPGTKTILHVSNGSLVFNGVHLMSMAREFPSQDRLVLVNVENGNLAVRNSSMTFHSGRSGETIGYSVTGSQSGADGESITQSQVLLDRSFFSGDRFTALEIDQSATDLVASNCVLASGDSPTVRVTESVPFLHSHSSTIQPKRILRFFSCTIAADQLGMEISSGNQSGDPPETIITSHNTVFGAADGGNSRSLLKLVAWPEQTGFDSNSAWIRNLVWMTNRCLFSGWKDLVITEPSSFHSVQGPETWQRFWGQYAQVEQFQPKAWPDQEFENLALYTPDYFDTSAIESVIKTSDGSSPGAIVHELFALETESLKAGTFLADRPRNLPVVKRDVSARNTVVVDVTERDLGRVISTTKWPNGTLFIVKGTGQRQCSPIRVEGKSLRIRFEAEAGRIPVLRPTQIPANAFQSNNESETAFLSVKGGSIEIENGRFRIPNSNRQAYMRWFLYVDDGSFSLKDTFIEGPVLDNPGYRGLIRWTKSGQVEPESALGYEETGTIHDCYLATRETMISADFRRRALLCENSVLVSLGTFCDMNLVGTDQAHKSTVDLHRCTLSIAKTIFDVQSSSGIGLKKDPFRFFISHTVFGSPLDSSSGGINSPTLLICSTNALQRREITWWGMANGYADALTVFVQKQLSSGSAPQQIETDWFGLWDPAMISRPLYGSGRVRFNGTPPAPLKMRIDDFQIDRASEAAVWSETGNPIGADISSLLHLQPES